jgi:periplasmic protein TonB
MTLLHPLRAVPARPLARAALALAVAAVAGLPAGPARAQFTMVPSSAHQAPPAPSGAADETAYRKDAARHVYAAYPTRIHKGKLPPMMYAVMITDTEIDAAGQVVTVKVARPPAAATEVTPWVTALIRRASPFPAPARVGAGGTVVYREIWLVDRTGTFQVDSLTEGQL